MIISCSATISPAVPTYLWCVQRELRSCDSKPPYLGFNLCHFRILFSFFLLLFLSLFVTIIDDRATNTALRPLSMALWSVRGRFNEMRVSSTISAIMFKHDWQTTQIDNGWLRDNLWGESASCCHSHGAHYDLCRRHRHSATIIGCPLKQLRCCLCSMLVTLSIFNVAQRRRRNDVFEIVCCRRYFWEFRKTIPKTSSRSLMSRFQIIHFGLRPACWPQNQTNLHSVSIRSSDIVVYSPTKWKMW